MTLITGVSKQPGASVVKQKLSMSDMPEASTQCVSSHFLSCHGVQSSFQKALLVSQDSSRL